MNDNDYVIHNCAVIIVMTIPIEIILVDIVTDVSPVQREKTQPSNDDNDEMMITMR